MTDFENSWNINVLINEVEKLKVIVMNLENEVKEIKNEH